MRVFSTVILLTAVGCQEYGFQKPPEGPSLPPPVIPVEPEVPVADAPVYANTTDQLFEVDPLTGARTLVGTFRSPSGATIDRMADIAIDLEGQVFGGSEIDDGIAELYQIDPTTADVELLCVMDIVPWGMVFTPSGDLIAADRDVIKRIDLDNCDSTTVVSSPAFSTSGDIVGLPDGFLYWTVRDEAGSDGLVRIDPVTWTQEYLGRIPVEDLFGLGYADDLLFGFTYNGETVSVLPEAAGPSGLVTTQVLSNDSSISWWGATTNPVAW